MQNEAWLGDSQTGWIEKQFEQHDYSPYQAFDDQNSLVRFDDDFV